MKVYKKVVFNVDEKTLKDIEEKMGIFNESLSVICRFALKHGLKDFDWKKLGGKL